MTNHYLHACTDCGIVHNELDTDVHGKDLLIEEDGIYWCRECWKEMDAARERAYEASLHRGPGRDEWRHEAVEAMRLK